MKAIRIHKYGGPEVLCFEEMPIPEPGRGKVRVKIEVSGINYIDIYHRTGFYPSKIPFSPGMEGAGVVDAIGEDVSEVKVGNRVVMQCNRVPMQNMLLFLHGSWYHYQKTLISNQEQQPCFRE